MTMLPAGQLRDRATIQRRTTEKGDRGQSTEVWEDIGCTSCSVEYLSGRKLELAKQLFTRATVQVKMRRPRVITMTPRDRLIVGSVTLTMGALVPKGDGDNDLEILCEVVQ